MHGVAATVRRPVIAQVADAAAYQVVASTARPTRDALAMSHATAGSTASPLASPHQQDDLTSQIVFDFLDNQFAQLSLRNNALKATPSPYGTAYRQVQAVIMARHVFDTLQFGPHRGEPSERSVDWNGQKVHLTVTSVAHWVGIAQKSTYNTIRSRVAALISGYQILQRIEARGQLDNKDRYLLEIFNVLFRRDLQLPTLAEILERRVSSPVFDAVTCGTRDLIAKVRTSVFDKYPKEPQPSCTLLT